MTFESTGAFLIDEIDRLFVVYEKAKEYLNKISNGVDQQINLWQHRRRIIVEQTKPLPSFEFLLPKTQRINEITIEAVQALCRVDLFIEQILRLDHKLTSLSQTQTAPKSTSFSARPLDTYASHSNTNHGLSRIRQSAPSPSLHSLNQQQLYGESVQNDKIYEKAPLPVPVLRTYQPQTTSTRTPPTVAQENSSFKPIEQQRSSSTLDNTSKPTPVHPPNAQYPPSEGYNFARSTIPSYEARTPQPEHTGSSIVATSTNNQTKYNYQEPPRDKVQVKLQRIPPSTKWKRAKIDIIDSLSAFYVENLDIALSGRFSKMSTELQDYYNNLEQSNRLIPLENVSIGDFGVAKYAFDNHWHRARVLMCEEHDSIRIVFIDSGNIDTKLMCEFFPLSKAFVDLPAQAIACTLAEAFPLARNENDSLWSTETIQNFRNEVAGKIVEVIFVDSDDATEWPLHFVKVIVNNQNLINHPSLKPHIELRPNSYIAEQLATSLTHQEYILFNVPINDDELN